MFRSIIYRLLARIVYYPSQQALVLRVPIEDFKGVTLRSWTIQKGYLVVEMAGEPVPKPLEEFSCPRC
jgi:hypothetical protein